MQEKLMSLKFNVMIQCRLPSPTEKYFDVGGTILSWRLDEETFFRSKSN